LDNERDIIKKQINDIIHFELDISQPYERSLKSSLASFKDCFESIERTLAPVMAKDEYQELITDSEMRLASMLDVYQCD
jgi:hypothetical protein